MYRDWTFYNTHSINSLSSMSGAGYTLMPENLTSPHKTNSPVARISLQWDQFYQRSLNKLLWEEGTMENVESLRWGDSWVELGCGWWVTLSSMDGECGQWLEVVGLSVWGGEGESSKSQIWFCPWSEVAQSCPTLCDPMDCSPPGSSVHGVFRQKYWSGLPFPSP